MAASQTSTAVSPNLTTLDQSEWTTGSCGAATTNNAVVTGDFEICATSVTYTAGGTSPITGKITLNKGGNTFTLPDNLTLSGNLWVFSGTLALGSSTLTMPAAGSLLENGSTITMGSGGITFGAGSKLDNYGSAATFTAGTGTITFNGAGTIKSAATAAALVLYDVVSTGGLTINHAAAGASVKIGRNLTIGGDVIGVGGGELILPNAAHTITSTAPSVTISSLLSTSLGTQTITLVPASAVGNSITVSSYGTIGGTITVACTGGVFTGSVTGATATLGGSGGAFTCTKANTITPVSASLNLMSNEKPVIFAEEVEMK